MSLSYTACTDKKSARDTQKAIYDGARCFMIPIRKAQNRALPPSLRLRPEFAGPP
jgi:hypothetical protein